MTAITDYRLSWDINGVPGNPTPFGTVELALATGKKIAFPVFDAAVFGAIAALLSSTTPLNYDEPNARIVAG